MTVNSQSLSLAAGHLNGTPPNKLCAQVPKAGLAPISTATIQTVSQTHSVTGNQKLFTAVDFTSIRPNKKRIN